MNFKNYIRTILKFFNLTLVKNSTFEMLLLKESAASDLDLLLSLPNDNSANFIKYLKHSKSQLRQDLFVLSMLGYKPNGFFVEFGATNGVDLSNTYLMEKEFGWIRILAEPAKCWHKDLRSNRSAIIETDCVWKDSESVLTFKEVELPELSTIELYRDADDHKKSRRHGKSYEVKTTSLNDLLLKHKAPKIIDYLSIDTEGSEYEILSNFDFSQYSFKVITCEHNYTPMRQKIHDLLYRNGYVRVLEHCSKFDDWYVKV